MNWKVLSASVSASVLTEGWNLATLGADVEEIRRFSIPVVFDAPFQVPPVVQIGLTLFDIDQRDSGRLSVTAESITESGFEIVFTTWSSTRVYAASASWLAVGA